MSMFWLDILRILLGLFGYDIYGSPH